MKLNIIFDDQQVNYKITFKPDQVNEYSIIDDHQVTENRESDLLTLGRVLRNYREEKGESITSIASSIGVDRSYLSKLENGHERPTIIIFNKIVRHYSINPKKAHQLATLAGYAGGGLIVLNHQERR